MGCLLLREELPRRARTPCRLSSLRTLGDGLIQEGLRHIAEKFASPDHTGPKAVADFDELTDPEERAVIQRDAYERVQDMLRRVGMQ